MPSHYKVSYSINIYYHIYVSANIKAVESLDVINSNRCLRFSCNEQEGLEEHEGLFSQEELVDENGIASIFMNSSEAPMEKPCIYHVYVNNGNDHDAMNAMMNLLNELNEPIDPVIIRL